MNKKAELSMEIIIVAVIAIIVLVTMIYVYSGRTSIFIKTLDDCNTRGGIPEASQADCQFKGGTVLFQFKEGETTKFCCLE